MDENWINNFIFNKKKKKIDPNGARTIKNDLGELRMYLQIYYFTQHQIKLQTRYHSYRNIKEYSCFYFY